MAFDSKLTPISQEPERPLLICIGASVRAMAFSAIRAGFRPICFDYFADIDLQRAVRDCGTSVTKISGYDDATLRLIDELPSDIPLMYGGAVENYADFVDTIARGRPVWGVTGDALRRCRNPWIVQEVAATHGFHKLACHQERPPSGDWIWKPFASGGGLDIDNPQSGKPGYWQQKVQGRGDLSYFGVRSRNNDFSFLGSKELDSIGETVHQRDVTLTRDHSRVWNNDGSRNWPGAIANIARDLDVLGCFGVDFIDDDLTLGGQCILEINPRFTSTAELYERVTGRSFVSEQAKAFGYEISPACQVVIAKRSRKIVLFAPYRLRSFVCPPTANALNSPVLADVPECGSVIEKDEPICTMFFDDLRCETDDFFRMEESVLSQCQRL